MSAVTIPGISPITATALATLAPPPEVFRKGRDFGPDTGSEVNRRHTKDRDHLEDRGANSATASDNRGKLGCVSGNEAYSAPAGSWLARMLARKPRMLVITALTNKMARTVWALMAKNEIYRAPIMAA